MNTPLERVLTRTTKRADGCWVFTGATRNGYGAIGVDGKTVYTHRLVYIIDKGPIPDDLVLDHLCRNRLCCNPAHLEPTTRGDNVRRGLPYRTRVAECHRGHAYTEANTYTNPLGYKVCRTCKRERWNARSR